MAHFYRCDSCDALIDDKQPTVAFALYRIGMDTDPITKKLADIWFLCTDCQNKLKRFANRTDVNIDVEISRVHA